MLRKETLPLMVLDLLLALLAWWVAFWLRLNLEVPEPYFSMALKGTPWMLLCYGVGLGFAKVYRHVWRYIGLPELRQLGVGLLLSALATAAVVQMLRMPDFPRSVLLIQPLLALVLLGAVRAAWRTVVEHAALVDDSGSRPLLIVGTLPEAADALRALKGARQWRPVGIVSSLAVERGRSLQNVRVLGTVDELARISEVTGADTVLVASAPGADDRQALLLQATGAGLTALTLPRADEWMRGDMQGPRKIEIEDLLGRAPVQLDFEGLSNLIAGQTVMVTGAGGSIGSELCRQIVGFGVNRLVCVDVSEFAIYRLEQELRESHPQTRAMYYTANVRESERLLAIARQHQPTVVLHAAAYKHVPLMEDLNEIEALRTNILGTLNAARAAGAVQARRFVLVSTDKAVNPTNIMGATKRVAERVVQTVATEFPDTQYVSVRFGNVLGSSGSVVPLFERQIAKGGPVTVTHPDIVRYFMTIAEACQLVLQAGLMGQSRQIFVLDMGAPVKVLDLARMMIRLSGHTEQEIPITFTGLRPGEKLYEELLANDETTQPTPHAKLRIAKGLTSEPLPLAEVQAWISQTEPEHGSRAVRDWLRVWVPEYGAPP